MHLISLRELLALMNAQAAVHERFCEREAFQRSQQAFTMLRVHIVQLHNHLLL